MARVEARPTIGSACTECKERTYTTRRTRDETQLPGKIYGNMRAERPTTYI